MAINIGPKIGIDGEKAFRDEIQKIGQQLKVLDSEMKIVTNSFKLEGDEQAGLIAKSEVLTKQIDAQKKGIEELKKGLDASTEAYGKNNVNTLKWQKSLYDAIADVNRMTNELEATEAEMNGAADATGDMEKATVDAGDAAEETGSRFGGLGTALKTVAGLAAATAASVAAATGKLVKDVVSSFSELEQNTGGAEAVFGEYALAIQKTGEEAYKNLGVSQSEYLATANKMGALFQGSGIEQQASLELTEQAMQRAADMASVMGIETSAALEAVAGAAKGNFEMMDNLGVAMNATSIEAYAVGKGLDFVWNEASQADKVQVAMQMFFEKTEQYAGNFARESEKTISGSMGMLKASVKSLTAGLGNAGADMTNLAGNVVTAFLAMVNNITPVIQNIVSAVPAVIQQITSGLVSAAPALLATVSEVFTSVLTTLNESLPQLLPVIMSALSMVANTLIENLPLLMDTSLQILLGLIDSVSENLPALIPMVVQAVLTIAQRAY